MNLRLLPLFFVVICVVKLEAQFDKNKQNYQKFEGFFDYYYDPGKDKIYLAVDKVGQEFLYVYSLSSGIGSNDIGLDRGQIGNEQVVYFKKTGNKLLLVQPNLQYRANTDNVLERKSVEQAFAKSIIFGAVIEESEGDTHYIDISEFLMRDAHGVVSRLKMMEQGSYSLDPSRSAINLERTRAFPKNSEFDVFLTFKGSPKGSQIRSVTPDPRLITVAQHHSFIALPEAGFEQRVFDPRSGSFPFSYYDYATPVEEPILKRFVPRHRLKKKDPTAALSEAVEPIVYYLDNGTPEPVRSALLEGGRWWNQAFEAIGYKDAFQVKILPDDADPLDVRYNVIQWVHRSTRGWSYGNTVTDPRTGEIIKGHVSLGSLRIRQDFLIAQALSDRPFAENDDNHEAILNLALARIRQLSAHEIGHTLGFAHNFAASTNGRASVMDYPHPYVKLKDGGIDFSEAYDEGIGAWDKTSIAYAYSDFPESVNEREALNKILEDAYSNGLQYISDRDARPRGGAHANAHLWDNGEKPSDELNRVLEVRKRAIDNFSVENIRNDEPYSVLEDVFVPLYLFHRYQSEATVKMIGGLNYNYSVRGDNFPDMASVSRSDQEAALEAMLKTINAEVIAVPENKLHLFPPRAIGYYKTRESFRGYTGTAFDPIAAAQTAADLSLGLLFHPERASRLIQQKSLDAGQLGLDELLDEILKQTIENKHRDPYINTVQTSINYRVLDHLMALGAAEDTNPQVNASSHSKLRELRKRLISTGPDKDHQEMVRRIDTYFDDPSKYKSGKSPKIPDGSPIGMFCGF